jgi:predicted P-loop ATPase
MTTKNEKDFKPADKSKTLAIVEVKQALSDWYDLRYNQITNLVEGRKKHETDFKPLNENDLFIQLLSKGYRITIGNLCALLNSEFVKPYDPFKNYFDSLPPWNDKNKDYIEELANHVKAKDQQQFNHHFKKMLVRCIACALVDKYYNKHAFILVGRKQNTGKSTFCRELCPPDLQHYLSETIPNDKDGLISLCENFLINLDELSTLSKFELKYLKSLFSYQRVKVRHPFARKSQTDPRRVSFIGSTNEDTFLTDSTGSVRWLCFEIDSIDWEYSSSIDINNVWSQAYSLFKAGFAFKLSPDEIKENEARNQQFQQITMEHDYIQKYFSPGIEFENDAFLTPTDIRDYIISMAGFKAEIRSLEKIGKALVQLGYERISKRTSEKDYPVYGYFIKYLNK